MTKMTRDVHLTGKDLMEMVQLRPEDIGKYAIVPGPQERMQAVVKELKDTVKNFSFMEYTMYTGNLGDIKVTTINGGRFTADTSITTEILCNAQVKGMIRIGSCGALTADMKIGDLVVVTSALKGDGVTQYYVDKDVLPKGDLKLSKVLFESAASVAPQMGLIDNKIHQGICWTTDALLRETKDVINKAIDQGAVVADMVTSAFLAIANVYNIPAAAILAVSDNVITGEMGFMNPDYYMSEASMINIAIETIKKLEG